MRTTTVQIVLFATFGCWLAAGGLSGAAKAQSLAAAVVDAQGKNGAAEPSLRLALLPPKPIPLPPVDEAIDSSRLTLTEVEELAIANHPALRVAEGRLQAARGNWLQVGLPPNPHLGYLGSEIGNSGRAGQQGGFVSQEYVTANKLGLNRAVAMRDVAAAEQALARTRLQILTTVRIRFFEDLAAERAVALARQLTTMAQEAVRVSELRLHALEGTRTALLQSQIERDSAALMEQQAANRHQAAWRRLASVIGVNGETPPTLDNSLLQTLPELDWETSRERILSGSPELAESKSAVERARCAIARASAGRVPNVDTQAGVQYDSSTEDTFASVQVSMPVPIFNRNQGAIAQAGGELTAAQAALEAAELAIEQRLAVALRDYETARQRVVMYQETILPAARESLDMVAKAYEQGELEYLEVLTVQQTYTQKNVAYLQDVETAWKRWAEIEGLLVGVLADNST